MLVPNMHLTCFLKMALDHCRESPIVSKLEYRDGEIASGLFKYFPNIKKDAISDCGAKNLLFRYLCTSIHC